jgi:hypothetical protein
MDWQKYVVPFIAGAVAGAEFMETRVAGAFAAGIFVVTWDPWVIVAFIAGMVVGQLISSRKTR